MSEASPVLDVRGLTVSYAAGRPAVDRVSFSLGRGEILGLVGESGSGKSTTAIAVLGLVRPPGRVDAGSVLLEGDDLLLLSRAQLRTRRWSSISFVPQGAMNALNPVMRVQEQIADVIRAHEGRVGGAALRRRIGGLLAAVELPERTARLYPHELSGGMKQRVCVAMAVALEPQVVIADEPTSALDVIVQRAVAGMLRDVQRRFGASFLLIGHDMALQAQVVDRLGVMYQGRLVEIGPVRSVFSAPAHPYTRLLLQAIPSLHERTWTPGDVDRALREEADGYLAAGHDLREVAPGHQAALP